MLSIQTNVNSLVAQQNLSVNSAFQSNTIQQLTSGYRINSSGDDAAGLAVANKFRNSVAELTQGVANGNDGLAQLQIMDGGMSNISQILDRLKTLAMQSASASFTSSRTPLNQEFQTDIGELDRQAQSIGLNTGGTFAKSLAVYLGAGTGSGTGSVGQTNSTVNVNLSSATVDSQALGLTGMQTGNTGFDLSTSAINTIKLNNSNQSANGNQTAQFQLSGPGFGNGININVALGGAGVGVTDGASLAAAINTAITAAGISNTALASAGITASVGANSANSKQMLTFSSANTAFQVRAGDQMANALLGNGTNAAGLGGTIAQTLQGVSYSSTFAANDSLTISVAGGGLTAPVVLTQAAGSGNTGTQTEGLIQTQVASGNSAADLALQAAGITVSTAGGKMVFSSANGSTLNVSVSGDVNNVLGFGSFVGPDATSFTAANAFVASTDAGNTVYLDLSLNGGAANTLSVTGATSAGNADSQADVIANINKQIALNATWKSAGIMAVDGGSGKVELVSTSGTMFRLGVRNSASGTSFGFYDTGGGGAGNVTRSANGLAGGATGWAGTTAAGASYQVQDAGGEYQLGSVVTGTNTAAPLNFTAITSGADTQALTLSAADSSGNQHSTVITLNQNTGSGHTGAGDIDQAIANINYQIQQTTDSTLKGITAVKVRGSGTVDQIEFESSVQNFSVNVGSTASGRGVSVGNSFTQGTSASSLKIGSGGAADISTVANATAAVQAITSAVTALGSAQAAVGKGENQLNYAINLAQSQITNFSSAESQIRDANVAQQAANLSKAQVLQQASIAAMAQANSAPQAVLALLK